MVEMKKTIGWFDLLFNGQRSKLRNWHILLLFDLECSNQAAILENQLRAINPKLCTWLRATQQTKFRSWKLNFVESIFLFLNRGRPRWNRKLKPLLQLKRPTRREKIPPIWRTSVIAWRHCKFSIDRMFTIFCIGPKWEQIACVTKA
jgi:hypothetical protein